MKNILVIGSGGREHALAWKLSKSKSVKHVFVIPGNIKMVSEKISIQKIDTLDFKKLINFTKENDIYLTIVGPELELSKGIVDAFEQEDLKIFGPNKYTTQLESSKSFCKKIMRKFQIPTANYNEFNNYKDIDEYIKNTTYPTVIKLDGLAAGKGVLVANNYTDAKDFIDKCLINKNSFPKIIVEEYLDGEEFSLLALVNGTTISFMQIAKDYKNIYDFNKGPNTGGMGAYTPCNINDNIVKDAKEIINKMVYGMNKLGHPFKGVLYAGLITTKQGVKVIEFNVRFGDPETELILSAMESDLFLLIDSVLNNNDFKITWSKQYYVGVVLASQGYPGDVLKNIKVPNLLNSNQIFYMGVKEENKILLSNGGRVLISVGKGKTLKIAKDDAYNDFNSINKKYFIYRSDISS